jgi:DNA-binding MarR family transcriptional regulator
MPEHSLSEQTKTIGRLIRRLMQAGEVYTKTLDKTYKVSVPQLACLTVLHEKGPLPPSRIAAEIMVQSSTVTGIIDRLEQKGLVRRMRYSSDRRVITIELTEAGADLAGNAPPPISRTIVDGLLRLPEKDIADIVRGLTILTHLLDKTDFAGQDILETGQEDSGSKF